MHDNTLSQIPEERLDSALAAALQTALVGTVFMLAISAMATFVFSLTTVL